jgi:hypothetical protein
MCQYETLYAQKSDALGAPWAAVLGPFAAHVPNAARVPLADLVGQVSPRGHVVICDEPGNISGLKQVVARTGRHFTERRARRGDYVVQLGV